MTTIYLTLTRQQWREAYNALKKPRPVRADMIHQQCTATDADPIEVALPLAYVWTSLDLLPEHIRERVSEQMNQQMAGLVFDYPNREA